MTDWDESVTVLSDGTMCDDRWRYMTMRRRVEMGHLQDSELRAAEGNLTVYEQRDPRLLEEFGPREPSARQENGHLAQLFGSKP